MPKDPNIVEQQVRKRRVTGVRELVLLTVGFGCMVGYTRMLALGFVGYFSQGVYASSDPWYALRSATSLVTLAVLACSGWRRWFKISTPAFMISVAVAIACAIVFAVDGNATFGWLIAVAGGGSAAVLMYVWMLLLSCYSAKAIVGAAIGGLAILCAMIVGVPYLDSAIALIMAVAAAFVAGSAAIMLDGELASCVPDGPLGGAAVRVPWLTVVMVLVCGFLATVLYGIAGQLTWLYDWAPNYLAFGVAAIIAIAATMAIILRSRTWQHIVWIPLFALFALALVFACLSIRESIQIAVGLMLAAVFCAHFLHWAIFPALFTTLKVPRAFLAGVVLVCVNGSVASALGNALGAALPHSVQNLGGVAGIMAVLLGIVLAVTFALYRRSFGAVGFLQAEAAVSTAVGVERKQQPALAEGALAGDGSGAGEAAVEGDAPFKSEALRLATPVGDGRLPADADTRQDGASGNGAFEAVLTKDEKEGFARMADMQQSVAQGFGEASPESAGEPVREPAGESVREPAEEAAREPAEEAREPAREAVRESAREAVREPAEEPTGEAGAVREPAASGFPANPLDYIQSRIETLSEEYGLTPREKEVAYQTAQGFSCAYIAEKLVVSNSTVRFHQKNLYRKLDVHSRNELIELVNGPRDE